jgi:phenylalanyl-tRNA synthetase beta chain
MKISVNWLKDYVSPLPSPDEVADRLTSSGLEVEEVIRIGRDFSGVIVGRVLDVRKHPDADRLTLCRVDVGSDEPLQIVCGAPNVAAEQLVPVATVGSTLELPPRAEGEDPQKLRIERRKVRGEYSEGMICAEDELGLSEDHSGIMVLDSDAIIGQSFSAYLSKKGVPTSDAVLDVSITPNRPDATSHFGIARDVAALTDARFSPPQVRTEVAGTSGALDIQIADPEACPRYVGVVVRGVAIGESPDWLKQRLIAVGLRPRNNVVDVTNYVMFECGQPLHAFDLNRLAGPAIRVRKSEGGESFTTLDDQKRTLPSGTLLICDAERPVAIAGIMGGANSEVDPTTTDLLIESAFFDPSTIRRASKALGLQTDSSYRFERGIDRDGQAWAAARAAELIVELAGGRIDEARDEHPLKPEPRTVELRLQRVTAVLGVEISAERIARDLTAIGFEVDSGDGFIQCRVPTFRPDVEREIDLIEEVARLFGYDNIPSPPRTAIPTIAPRVRPVDRVQDDLTARLAAIGLHEVHTNSMLRRETAERFLVPPLTDDQGLQVVETLNPISREMATLRPSLLPGVLQVMAHNRNHGQKRLGFFEFGHVFARTASRKTTIPGYDERNHLLIAIGGEAEAASWNAAARSFDFFDAKGMVEHVFASLGIAGVRYVPEYSATAVTRYSARIESTEGSRLGVIATLSDGIQHGFDLPEVHFAELDLDSLVRNATLDHSYEPVSRFPVVERDIALLTQKSVSAADLIATIDAAGGELLQRTTLFDLYEGDRIGSDRRSLAFNLHFAADRTLTDAEVEEKVKRIVSRLQSDHGAELRQ